MAGRIKAEDVALGQGAVVDRGRRARARDPAPRRPGLAQGPVPLPRREDARRSTSARPSAPGTASAAARAATSSRSCRRSTTSPSPRPSSGSPASSAWSCATRRAARPREEGLGRRSRLVEAHRVAAGVLRRRAAQRARRPGPAATSCARAASTARRAKRFGVGFAPRGGEDADRATCAPRASPTTSSSPAGCPAGAAAGSTTGSAGGWSGRSATSPATPSASARGGSSTTTGSRPSTSTPPRRPIYKKSTVLYGLDLAKKAIARDRQAVVVEGYTDVMACHLAGVETRRRDVRHGVRRRPHQDAAPDHARRGRPRAGQGRLHLRRRRGRPEGRDAGVRRGPALGLPVLRRGRADGHGPVRAAPGRGRRGGARTSSRTPCRCSSSPCAPRSTGSTSTTAEGRVQAMRAAAPIVAVDPRPARCAPSTPATVAGLARRRGRAGARPRCVGRAAPARAARRGGQGAPGARRHQRDDGARRGTPGGSRAVRPREHARRDAMPRPDLRDPVVFAERQLLQALLQFPVSFDPAHIDSVDRRRRSRRRPTGPSSTAVRGCRRAAAPPRRPGLGRTAVTEAAPLRSVALVTELAVAPLPTRFDPATGLPERRYIDELLDPGPGGRR